MYAENIVCQTHACTWKELRTFSILYQMWNPNSRAFCSLNRRCCHASSSSFSAFVLPLNKEQEEAVRGFTLNCSFIPSYLGNLEPSHTTSLSSLLYMQNGSNNSYLLGLLWEFKKIKCVLVPGASRKLTHTCFFPAGWFLWAVSVKPGRRHHFFPSFSLSLRQTAELCLSGDMALRGLSLYERWKHNSFHLHCFPSFYSRMPWLLVAHLKVQSLWTSSY